MKYHHWPTYQPAYRRHHEARGLAQPIIRPVPVVSRGPALRDYTSEELARAGHWEQEQVCRALAAARALGPRTWAALSE